MITSTKITDTEILAFIDALVFTLLSRTVLSINIKKRQKLLKSRLPF